MRAALFALAAVIFTAITIVTASQARAEMRVSVSLGSFHQERDNGYCEINPGLGGETRISGELWFKAGVYRHSRCRPAKHIGFMWLPVSLGGDVRFGVMPQLVYGYTDRPVKVPLPVLTINHNKRIGFNVPFLPPLDIPGVGDFRKKGVVGLELTVRF